MAVVAGWEMYLLGRVTVGGRSEYRAAASLSMLDSDGYTAESRRSSVLNHYD